MKRKKLPNINNLVINKTNIYEDLRCEILEQELVPGWTKNLDNDTILRIMNSIGLDPHKPKQFKIPAPFKAWCHECNKGFLSIDALSEHNVEKHGKGTLGLKFKLKKDKR